MRFKNKIVLITGASRGIGAESAKIFAQEGATVIINYCTDEKSAQKVLDEINGNGMIIKADISNQEAINNMFENIFKKYGKLDILVNNAGIVKIKSIKELSLDEWNKTYSVNITGMFLCSQKAINLMKDGGSIVNVSSIRGLSGQGRPLILDYSTSKAAVISLTKTMAKELAPDIRVNCVVLGMTNTDIAKTLPKESIEQFKKDIYLKRLIEPEEVAKSIVFLSSDDASAITGSLLIVDGGQSLS
ncbi:MAG: glucose 1-dehydrogenase [Nanoarchaeota archaeon]|nr:glucose 1-dehydrogenase [Nanoarchaeota archaeon]